MAHSIYTLALVENSISEEQESIAEGKAEEYNTKVTKKITNYQQIEKFSEKLSRKGGTLQQKSTTLNIQNYLSSGVCVKNMKGTTDQ